MENPIKMDDLGGKPTIFGNIQIYNHPMDDMVWAVTFWSSSTQVWLNVSKLWKSPWMMNSGIRRSYRNDAFAENGRVVKGI